MPVLKTSEIVKRVRERRGWSQRRLQDTLGEEIGVSISRLERDKLHPSAMIIESIGYVMKTPFEQFIYPMLDSQPMNVYVWSYDLVSSLDIGDLVEAERLLRQLKAAPGFNKPINVQFTLCQEARLQYEKGKDTKNIRVLIDRGIRLTLENYDRRKLGETILVFEEPALFRLMAMVYAKEGKFEEAVVILTGLSESLMKLPSDDREKETLLAPVLLNLAECQLKTREFSKMLETCNKGLEISATRCVGRYTDELLYLKALCLWNMGEKSECKRNLRFAFFIFELLHKRDRALEVLGKANELGLVFETYGVENIVYIQNSRLPYKRDDLVAAPSIAGMIKAVRKHKGLKQADLYQGICSKKQYVDMENGKVEPKIIFIEPILQRLGRDINHYCRFFLSSRDFEERGKREKLHLLLINRKHEDAEKMYCELKNLEGFKKGTNLQFIKATEATLHVIKYGNTRKYKELLLEALRITRPEFDIHEIGKYPITHYESVLIKQVASYFVVSVDEKSLEKAEKIFEQLLRKIREQFTDETEQARHYATLCYSYAQCLRQMNKTSKANSVIEDAVSFERNHERLLMLPSLICLYSSNLIRKQMNEESIPFLALAYYGCLVFSDYGKNAFLPPIRKDAMKYFGIEFHD